MKIFPNLLVGTALLLTACGIPDDRTYCAREGVIENSPGYRDCMLRLHGPEDSGRVYYDTEYDRPYVGSDIRDSDRDYTYCVSQARLRYPDVPYPYNDREKHYVEYRGADGLMHTRVEYIYNPGTNDVAGRSIASCMAARGWTN